MDFLDMLDQNPEVISKEEYLTEQNELLEKSIGALLSWADDQDQSLMDTIADYCSSRDEYELIYRLYSNQKNF